jgi:uncharacterized protein YhdP
MRILTRLVVFLLLVIALSLSFARYVLPSLIETYKDEILAQVSQVVGKNIEADGVSVFWREDGHGFHLRNLRLVNDDGSSDLKAESVYLKFSVMEVIRHLNIAPSEIRVVGTHLAVIRHEDGKVSIHGIEHSDDFDVDLSAMILQPVFLEVVDSKVTVIDLVHKNTLPLHFSPVNLLIRNDGSQHQLSAKVSIDEGKSGGFTLISRFQTESKNLEQWKGEVYLRTEQLDLAWLLQNRFPGHYNLQHAKTSMEIWSHWEKGRLLTLQGEMYSEKLHFRSQDVKEAPELTLDYFGGKFRWRREQNGWLLDIADPLIRHDDAVWPTRSIGIAVRQISGNGPLHFYLGADIFSIDGLFKALAVHPPDNPFMKDLFAAQAQGEVLNPFLHLRMHHPIEWDFNATLENLETKAAGIFPQVKGVRVMVIASHDSGSVKFAGSNASVYIKSLFREPMLLDQVTGELRWKKQPNGDWRIATDNLVAQTEHIKTTTSFRYTLPPQGKGYLDLLSDFQEGHVEHASIYYPAYKMPPAVVKWLDRSLTKGFVTSGRVVLQGPLQSFPYENNDDGFYEVLFDIKDAEIAYKQEWPPLKNVKARVRFHGNHLNIDVSEGMIYENHISQVSMEMQLKPASAIHLQGEISGSLAGPVRLLKETPLKKKFLPLMEALEMQGEGSLSVDMQIPLKKDHAAAFKGDLLLKNATINANKVDLTLHKVNGVLHMTDSGISADRLNARLLGSPLTMDIIPLGKGATKVKADVNLSATSLKRVIANAPVSGAALWRIDVEVPTLAQMQRGGLSLHTRSDLKGMKVDLPLSLGKSRSQKKVLDLVWKLSETTPAFKLSYGDLKLDMQHRKEKWSGTIKAKELSGKLTIPDAKQQQIRVDLERLNLVFTLHDKAAPIDKRRRTKPQDIRPFYLTSKQLLLNGRPFGTLSMKTRHTRSGHEMTELKVKSKNDSLVASGNWNQKKGRSTTDVNISLVAAEIGETLKSLDLSNQLEQAQGSIDADLNWQGAPADYTPGRLNGSLLLDTREGRFSEAQPGLARILGFLNIGALKRRLRLDFSDVTKKGFSFDEMRGGFVLNGGVVSSKNELVIKAPSADIYVSGDLDLGARQVNQRIRVIPDIHGMLPLAGVAAGGPAVGAALLVAGVVAGKQIDQIAEINYSVKGSWDNPEIVRVSRKKLFGGSQRQKFGQSFDDFFSGSKKSKRSRRSESSGKSKNPIGKGYDDPLADFQ